MRLIHALNDYATTDHFQYQSIQDAVDLVTPNCFFAKLDLDYVYRNVKIHPSNSRMVDIGLLIKSHLLSRL